MIPKFDEIRIQALKELSSGEIMRAKELRIPLAKHFGLTEEEMNVWYPSGNGEIFSDRISWALSYLFIAGLVEKPQKGDYKISKKGLSMLSSCTGEQINDFVKTTVNAKSSKKNSKNKDINNTSFHVEKDDERTPEEELADSYDRIKQNVQSQILTTVLSKQPQEFERLVVKLLQAMGYGGEIKNSGVVTKLSNDGGIDGVIKEDVLGFNHISIQAKRYSIGNNVQRHEVQSFRSCCRNAIQERSIHQTSDYTKGAMEYVESLNGSPTIILINGQQLTKYIYDYGLGLQTEKVLKVMKMDMDYWDAMDNA